MQVAGGHPEKFRKQEFTVFVWNAGAVVPDRDADAILFVLREKGHFRFGGIFDGVVRQIEYDVGKVKRIGRNERPRRAEFQLEPASLAADAVLEIMNGLADHPVYVNRLFFQMRGTVFQPGHLKHSVYLVFQVIGFVLDDIGILEKPSIGLDGLVIFQHFCGQLDGGNGRAELMGHIIDKVLLNFRELFLSEEFENADAKAGDHQKQENGGKYPESHLMYDELFPVGKQYTDVIVRLANARQRGARIISYLTGRNESNMTECAAGGIIDTILEACKDAVFLNRFLQQEIGLGAVGKILCIGNKIIWPRLGDDTGERGGVLMGEADGLHDRPEGAVDLDVEFLLFELIGFTHPVKLDAHDQYDQNGHADHDRS